MVSFFYYMASFVFISLMILVDLSRLKSQWLTNTRNTTSRPSSGTGMCYWLRYSAPSCGGFRRCFFRMWLRKCRTEESDEASRVHAGVQPVVVNVCRIVITISYYALILNTSNLHGDPYLNCFLSAATEVPAYLIALLLLQYCSRHFCQASTLFVGGVMILCVHLIPIGN